MRHNPLAGAKPTPQRRLARTTAPKDTTSDRSQITRAVLELSVETFAMLAGDDDLALAKKTRAAFAAWCATSASSGDWRKEWRAFRAAPGRPAPKRSRLEIAIAKLRNL